MFLLSVWQVEALPLLACRVVLGEANFQQQQRIVAVVFFCYSYSMDAILRRGGGGVAPQRRHGYTRVLVLHPMRNMCDGEAQMLHTQ